MIEKYTPLIRERKAKYPNTKATSAGTATTSRITHRKLSLPSQNHGSSFQSRKIMKSGSAA